ncbi:uncharacterized protein DS421_2g55950 [Arachis hypogaea]|nr:uncharacterized protein DS421_2g55950 [Arachis hypogaea]
MTRALAMLLIGVIICVVIAKFYHIIPTQSGTTSYIIAARRKTLHECIERCKLVYLLQSKKLLEQCKIRCLSIFH